MLHENESLGCVGAQTEAKNIVYFHSDSYNSKARTVSTQARERRQFEKLHLLGPRALLHFVTELVAACACQSASPSRVLADKLEEYARLTPEMLAVTGGDRWPRLPLSVIDGGRQ